MPVTLSAIIIINIFIIVIIIINVLQCFCCRELESAVCWVYFVFYVSLALTGSQFN